ncbi:MAG: ABC-2 type transport system permease protein, partial [Pseudohongiellaceae bacterium]
MFDKPASTPLLMRIARVLLAVTLPFARFLGADSVIVREIVETKLTIDLRRGTTLQRASGRKNIGMASNCLMMLVVGSAAAFALVFIRQPFFAMAIVQALMLYLLTAVLLTDYSDMVLGSVDDEILGPLPMQGRTLLVAQLLHVAIYLSLIVGCLLLPSLIVGCFTQPTLPWLAAMAVITPMTMACSLLGVVVAGLLIVRLVGPQRARQMLVTVQVVMTMFLMLAGQAPNLLRGTGAFDLLMAGDSYWLLLVPPLWFGGLYDVMVSGGTPMAGPLAMCAVVIPLLSLALALRLSRSHLTVSESSHALAKPSKGWLRRLGAKLCRTPCEQGAFALMLNLGHRERGFRMRCYPALVMPIVLLVP